MKNNVIYRHFNLPVIFPSVAFLGDKWSIDDNPATDFHFHNCIEIGYCKNGNGTIFIENDTFSYHANDYIFIPENVSHRTQSDNGSSSNWEYIFFDPYLLFQNTLPSAGLDRLLSESTKHYGIISSDQDKELHFLMGHAFGEFHKKEPYYQDSLKGLFISIIMLAVRNEHFKHELKSDFQWLYSSISYIRRNYQKKLSIAEIANYCGSSESYFRKKFNETMHISPLDYINHLRIRIACKSVYTKDRSISEIASDCGFLTLSSFNRNFQALLNCSPSEWRKRQMLYDDVIQITSMEDHQSHGIFLP